LENLVGSALKNLLVEASRSASAVAVFVLGRLSHWLEIADGSARVAHQLCLQNHFRLLFHLLAHPNGVSPRVLLGLGVVIALFLRRLVAHGFILVGVLRLPTNLKAESDGCVFYTASFFSPQVLFCWLVSEDGLDFDLLSLHRRFLLNTEAQLGSDISILAFASTPLEVPV